MGGTSTDVALCQNGQPTIGRETAIGHFRIKVPSVNVHTVGAGGGSIAHVPELTKALRVGPQSAGAEPGPGRVRQGRHRADRHRRERRRSATCPPQLLGGEMQLDVDAARDGGADDRRRDGPRLGRAGGRGDPRDRQREHGGRAAARLGAARPRPARLRARRLRRRRPAARERAREADGLVPGDRPARAGPALRDRRPRRRLPRRVRPDVHPPARRRRAGRGRARSSTGSARARRLARGRGHPRRRAQRVAYSADMRYHRQGYEIPVALDPERGALDGLADLEERFNGLHEQLYGFRMPGTRVRDRQPARGRLRHRAEARAAGRRGGRRRRLGAVVDEHEVVFDGERTPTKIYDRVEARAGERSTARRSSPSSTRRPSSCPATGPRST